MSKAPNEIDFYRTRDIIVGVPSEDVATHDPLNPHLSAGHSPPIVNGVPLFNQIQIQTIEFCNLKCDFCPNHYLIWDRLDNKKKGIPHKAMSIENYTKIVRNLADLNFTGRISPYLMNEPLMDKDRMVEIIGITRENLPESPIKINTNGTGLTTKLLSDMIDAGLTSIQVDDYFDDKYAERLYKQLKPFEGVNGKCFITLNSNYNVNQVKKRNQDVTEPHFGPFTYWNRAGLTNVNPDMPVPQKDCVWPTNHMVIKHDGDVLLCCCDWEYKVVHGNVFTDRIEEVWTNASFQHYRDTLKQGRRDKLRMCRKCNKGSFNNEADRIENLKVWMEKKSIGESVSETI